MAIETQKTDSQLRPWLFSTRLVSVSWDCSISESVSWDVVAVAIFTSSK